ncbi:T9SS type A sorting domain-containing protein [Marinilabilia rubra]|nr:T9SS type A sorting domain-containing protein [Marinilabilia rubra]
MTEKGRVDFAPPPASVIAENSYRDEKGRPLQFAFPNFVKLSPHNSGETTVMDDGRLLWQLRIKSEGAYSINLIFDEFFLSRGDSVFIYNPSGDFVIGALTHQNNKKWGGLATAPVPGDEVIVEWRGTNSLREGTRIMIGAVNHDYLNIYKYLNAGIGEFGASGSCHSDLTCSENGTYVLNGRSVCQVIVGGTEYCSGTLMNNSNNDGIPYVLTAGHCLGSQLSPESVVFIFNYEVPSCQTQIQGSMSQSISGSYLRAFADQLDFALLEMSDYPPEYFRAYYSGWDINETHSSIAHSIHHPSGDVKKLAVSLSNPENATFNANSVFGNSFEPNSHWRIAEWNEGTTEGGSSGCGLFDEDGQTIGLLSGGSATCSNPVNDYFVRLNKIWDFLPYDTARVDVWLNPSGDGRSIQAGYDPNNATLLRFSHFPNGGIPQLVSVNGGYGKYTGPNSLQITDVAERYNELASGVIYGVFLMPGENIVNGSGHVTIKIWSGVDSPQLLIEEKSGVVIQGSTDKEVLVLFDEPVRFSGPFFVGYEIDNTAPVDDFAVYQAPISEGDNSLFLNDPATGWQSYEDLTGNGSAILWMEPLVGEIVFTDSSDIDFSSLELVLGPNPVSNLINFRYHRDGEGLVSVFDLAGRKIFSSYVGIFNNRGVLEFEHSLMRGVYFLQLEIEGEKVVKKFIW